MRADEELRARRGVEILLAGRDLLPCRHSPKANTS